MQTSNNYRQFRQSALLVAFVIAAIFACPLPSLAKPLTSAFYEWSNLDPVIPPGTLLRWAPLKLPPFYRATAWRILYMTRDYAGKPIVSSGTVILSGYASPRPEARNIVAWAHPTTGVARKCAPSLRKSPIESITGVKELISGGCLIAATDYPGLATPGPIGYLVGKGQARAVIDSVRAVRQIPGAGGGSRFALWGYSQGGHAALFGAALARSYAPELQLAGVAVTAPPTDLAALLIANISTVPGRILAAMTLRAWSVKYDASLSQLADDQVFRVIQAVAANCIDNLGGKLDALAAQKPLKAKFLSVDPATIQPWRNMLHENSIAQLPSGIAAFVAQGTDDEIVRHNVTMQFIRQSCRAGNRITYVALKGLGHGSSAKASAAQAVAWINGVFSGRPPPNSCR